MRLPLAILLVPFVFFAMRPGPVVAAEAGVVSCSAGLQAGSGASGYRSGSLWFRASGRPEGLDGDLNAKPSVNSYHSDSSSGTSRSYSLRLGYSQDPWDAGLTLGASPVVNGYGNTVFGLDASYTLEFGPADEDGDEPYSLDLGAGMTNTKHTEEFHGTFVGPRGRTRTLNGTTTIGQTDLSASASVSAWETTLEAGVTGSSYDKDVEQNAIFAARRTPLAGLSSLVSGFPKSSRNLRLSYDGLPRVAPFVSVTRTVFALQQPDSGSLSVGAYVTVTKAVELNVSWERYVQAGTADQHYVSAGAKVRF